MKPISREEAQLILRPYHGTIVQCFTQAWENFQKIMLMTPSALGRDRRGFMSALVDQEIRTQLGARPGVTIRVAHQRVLAYIEDKLILFNKFFLDGSLATSNNETPTSLMFDHGLTLPKFPDTPRVCAGYRVDRLETAMRVYIKETRLRGWSYQIGHEEEQVERVLQFPTAPAPVPGKVLPFRRKEVSEPRSNTAGDSDREE